MEKGKERPVMQPVAKPVTGEGSLGQHGQEGSAFSGMPVSGEKPGLVGDKTAVPGQLQPRGNHASLFDFSSHDAGSVPGSNASPGQAKEGVLPAGGNVTADGQWVLLDDTSGTQKDDDTDAKAAAQPVQEARARVNDFMLCRLDFEKSSPFTDEDVSRMHGDIDMMIQGLQADTDPGKALEMLKDIAEAPYGIFDANGKRSEGAQRQAMSDYVLAQAAANPDVLSQFISSPSLHESDMALQIARYMVEQDTNPELRQQGLDMLTNHRQDIVRGLKHDELRWNGFDEFIPALFQHGNPEQVQMAKDMLKEAARHESALSLTGDRSKQDISTVWDSMAKMCRHPDFAVREQAHETVSEFLSERYGLDGEAVLDAWLQSTKGEERWLAVNNNLSLLSTLSSRIPDMGQFLEKTGKVKVYDRYPQEELEEMKLTWGDRESNYVLFLSPRADTDTGSGSVTTEDGAGAFNQDKRTIRELREKVGPDTPIRFAEWENQDDLVQISARFIKEFGSKAEVVVIGGHGDTNSIAGGNVRANGEEGLIQAKDADGVVMKYMRNVATPDATYILASCHTGSGIGRDISRNNVTVYGPEDAAYWESSDVSRQDGKLIVVPKYASTDKKTKVTNPVATRGYKNGQPIR